MVLIIQFWCPPSGGLSFPDLVAKNISSASNNELAGLI
jgi:hypothetical protein